MLLVDLAHALVIDKIKQVDTKIIVDKLETPKKKKKAQREKRKSKEKKLDLNQL